MIPLIICRFFESGRLLVTHTAEMTFEPEEIFYCVKRHLGCDWGDIDAADRKANDAAVRDGERLVSRYNVRGHRMLIITEANRSTTTIMLLEDY